MKAAWRARGFLLSGSIARWHGAHRFVTPTKPGGSVTWSAGGQFATQHRMGQQACRKLSRGGRRQGAGGNARHDRARPRQPRRRGAGLHGCAWGWSSQRRPHQCPGFEFFPALLEDVGDGGQVPASVAAGEGCIIEGLTVCIKSRGLPVESSGDMPLDRVTEEQRLGNLTSDADR